MLVTDLFQFALKMAMIIVLAWVAVAKIGGMQALQMHLQEIENNVRATGVQTANPVAFLPDFHLGLTTGCALDFAGSHLHRLSRNAVVAGVVSRRGAWRRRIRGAANV